MSRRLALLIGNSVYNDHKNLPPLVKAVADVHAIAQVLRAPDIGAFDNVQELIDRPVETLKQAIDDFFFEKKRDDLLLLYFTGHGRKDERERWHFACKDTNIDHLPITSISGDFIRQYMDDCKSTRQILILDACYSGAFFQGAKGEAGSGKPVIEQVQGRGRAVLSATNAVELAWEGDGPTSVLTSALVQGLLTGEADKNKDGEISVHDWFNYASEQVADETNKQTPEVREDYKQGEIIIARNPYLAKSLQQEEQPRPAEARQIHQEQVVRQPDPSSSRLALSSRNQQKRPALLKSIREVWVEGLLKQSRHEETHIHLHLQEQANVLHDPQRSKAAEPSREHFPLPPDPSILEIYDRADGSLLILGEAGAGKTTLLLELASLLLDRADRDLAQPVAVIFQLPSWAQKRLPLADWLAEELQRMNLPQWGDQDKLLPLLDGLDEVAPEAQTDCVQAINLYYQDRLREKQIPLVVCCRDQERQDYPALQELLRWTVIIQPLTDEQIDAYLHSIGGQFQGLQAALGQNQELRELARQPLMLSIFALVYPGPALSGIPTRGTPEDRRYYALDDYVRLVLARQKHWNTGTEKEIRRHLIYLAQQTIQRQETFFSLEEFEPWWSLRENVRQHGLHLGLLTLLIAVLSGPVGWLVSWLIGIVIALGSWVFTLGKTRSWPHSFSVAGIGGGTWVIIVLLFLIALWVALVFYVEDRDLWSPAPLVDEAVSRGLLYKVGGRYMFRHSLLRNYFTSPEA